MNKRIKSVLYTVLATSLLASTAYAGVTKTLTDEAPAIAIKPGNAKPAQADKEILLQSTSAKEVNGVTYWNIKDIEKLGYTIEQDGYLSYIKNGQNKVYITMYNSIEDDNGVYISSNTLRYELNLNVTEIDGKPVVLKDKAIPSEHFNFLHTGDTLEMDIDSTLEGGDKSPEKISVTKVSEYADDYCADYVIKVDDASISTSITTPTDNYAVAEVSKDNFVIALSGTGMSSDCYTEFYQYLPKSKSIKQIGTIEGLILGGMTMKDGMIFNFDEGTVTTENRLDVVHTGWYKADYKFGTLGADMQLVKKDFYTVNNTPLTMKMDFTFSTAPDIDAPVKELLAGTKLNFVETDDLYWAKFTANGQDLYLRLAYEVPNPEEEEFHYSSSFYNALSVTPIYAEDIFEGLLYAD